MSLSTMKKASEILYEEILKGARHPKTNRAIERIKSACDYLAEKGIGISVSEVGLRCKETGPAEQSIRNNGKFHKYVLDRASEQNRTVVKKRAEIPPLITDNPQWNAEIQTLQAALRRATQEFQHLKRAVENAGEYDIQKSISEGRLVLPESSSADNSIIFDEAFQTIERLLDPATLERFGFEVVRGRVIAPELNEAEFITKIDWERIQNAIALNRDKRNGLPSPR